MARMESSRSTIIANITDLELDARASDIDLNSTKQSCRLCNGKGGSNSRRSIGNIILLSLPICLFALPTIFISIAYIYGQVEGTLKLPPTRNVPYISDIGEGQPQSGFFSIGLTLGAIFTIALVVVRYLQVQYSVESINPWVNPVGLGFGLFIAVGQITVAAFELSGITSVHYIGAMLFAFSAVVYAPIQTYISHKEKTLCGRYRELFLYLRGLLSAGSLLGFIIFGLFLIPPLVKYNQPGYSVAQAGEWCFAACTMLFMLTFTVDFWPLQPKFVIERL